MPQRGEVSLEETAYHEAGHAIFALASGVDVPELSIIPEEECLGGCGIDYAAKFMTVINPVGNEVDLNLALLRYVSFLAAGRQAQRRLLICQQLDVDEGKLDNGAGLDYQMIHPSLASLRDAGCEVDFGCLLLQIDAYLLRQDVWPVLEQLAASLLEKRELHDLLPGHYGLPAFTPVMR